MTLRHFYTVLNSLALFSLLACNQDATLASPDEPSDTLAANSSSAAAIGLLPLPAYSSAAAADTIFVPWPTSSASKVDTLYIPVFPSSSSAHPGSSLALVSSSSMAPLASSSSVKLSSSSVQTPYSSSAEISSSSAKVSSSSAAIARSSSSSLAYSSSSSISASSSSAAASSSSVSVPDGYTLLNVNGWSSQTPGKYYVTSTRSSMDISPSTGCSMTVNGSAITGSYQQPYSSPLTVEITGTCASIAFNGW